MARLSLALLALFAVVVTASANAPPSSPKGGHHVRQWAHQKKVQLKQWGHNEKVKLQNAWKVKVVPQIKAAEKKFGAQWQQKAPQIRDALKKQAGIYFDKAVALAKQQLNKVLSG